MLIKSNNMTLHKSSRNVFSIDIESYQRHHRAQKGAERAAKGI